VTEEGAVDAYHVTEGMFDGIEGVKSFAKKRTGSSLLWRLDDEAVVAGLMVQRLSASGLFLRVEKLDEAEFWAAGSDAV